MTLKQIAEQFGVSPFTVQGWRKRGLFPNAQLRQTLTGPIWLVPQSDIKGFKPPATGRPKKATTKKADKKSTKKGEGKRSSTDETNG